MRFGATGETVHALLNVQHLSNELGMGKHADRII